MIKPYYGIPLGLRELENVPRRWEDANRYDPKLTFHFGLIPQPFCGDIQNAEIYILTANPAIHSSDYSATYDCPTLRRALIENLKQDCGLNSFIWLDRRFEKYSGYKFWHDTRKLNRTIKKLAKYWNLSKTDAQRKLASKIAVIELFPYHSKFSTRSWPYEWGILPSSELALEFVRKHVLSRLESGNAIALLIYRAKTWQRVLDDETNGMYVLGGQRAWNETDWFFSWS